MRYDSDSITSLVENKFDHDNHGISGSVIDSNMVKNLYDPVSEGISGGAVEISDCFGIGSGFADHMEDNLSEEYDMETAEFYSRNSLAALGTIMGAEMENEGFPEADLESDLRAPGFVASGICMKTGVMN